MPDESNTANSATAPVAPTAPVASAAPAASPVVEPVLPTVPVNEPLADAAEGADVRAEVARRIGEAHNVLIALSSDPSVDEMATAIGLSLYLDKLGKRATAIYSGSTPNALEFLKPEETFEPSVDTLQDFVIALNKDKADHLRYKLDGDYVKIYITPYKSRISEEDLDFSYGDFNVDLVLALDVANGVDLDAALREHGRIMHDASIINITTGNPGKLGEIEWSDKSASSVAEMMARLLYTASTKTKIGKEEATAFLTGIVAATNRFANAKTTAETMKLASRLIASGANQQLVSKNITPDIDNEAFNMRGRGEKVGEEAAPAADLTKLDIAHGNEEVKVDETKEVDDVVTEKDSTLLEDLKAAEASLAGTGAETVPEVVPAPVEITSEEPVAPVAEPVVAEPVVPPVAEPTVPEPVVPVVPEPVVAVSEPVAVAVPVLPEVTPESVAEPVTSVAPEPVAAEPVGVETVAPETETMQAPGEPGFISSQPEKVIQPSVEAGDLHALEGGIGENKYGQMLEDALESANPAMNAVPSVPSAPEINGVPEINYMPMPGDAVLPPPPTPSIESTMPPTEAVAPVVSAAPVMPAVAPAGPAVPITPAAPVLSPTPEPLGAQPSMQDQVYNPQAADPGAFKIPGM